MKLTVEVPESKAAFILELLHSLPFVTVQEDKKARKVAQKAELMADVREAILELNEVLSGRKESRDAYELLAQLDEINAVQH